jgi:hypothetical protein
MKMMKILGDFGAGLWLHYHLKFHMLEIWQVILGVFFGNSGIENGKWNSCANGRCEWGFCLDFMGKKGMLLGWL